MVTVIGFVHDSKNLSEHEECLEDVFEIPQNERKDVAQALSNMLYEVGVIANWQDRVLTPQRVVINGVTYKLGGVS